MPETTPTPSSAPEPPPGDPKEGWTAVLCSAFLGALLVFYFEYRVREGQSAVMLGLAGPFFLSFAAYLSYNQQSVARGSRTLSGAAIVIACALAAAAVVSFLYIPLRALGALTMVR